MLETFSNYISEHEQELLDDLTTLINIPSVAGPSVTKNLVHMPFGEGVHQALEAMLKIAERDGFKVKNIDNYGAHIEFGEGDEILGILGHLDVVPEGAGWDTDPYGATIKDGRMYGRGTADDKGPIMASYYAMKALRDSGFVPNKRVRLILGLDEEGGAWEGMKYYLAHEEKPTFGFTPDGDFPVIMAEKGIVTFELVKKFGKTVNKGLELRSMQGGDAYNVVANHARAVVKDENPANYEKIKDLAASFRDETGYKVNTRVMGKSMEISTEGQAAHGSHPEKGLNAISILMKFLGNLNFVNEDAGDFIEFYNKYIGFELDGTSLGCGFCDEPSGKLVLNVGLLRMDKESAGITINVRFPVTNTLDEVYEGIKPVVDKYNLGIVKKGSQLPLYKSADDPLIRTFMEVYADNTGDTESEPLVIGGGTYARVSENIFAFGMIFPNDLQVEHMPNEYVPLDKLMLSTRIFADAIYRLTK